MEKKNLKKINKSLKLKYVKQTHEKAEDREENNEKNK